MKDKEKTKEQLKNELAGLRQRIAELKILEAERKQAEQALLESEHKYRSLFESMLNSFAYCKILVDENNQPIDYVHLEVNDAWERAVGLKRKDVIGKKITEVIPGIKESKPDLISIYGKVALTGEATRFELYFEPLGKWFTASVYSPKKGYFVAVFENITERKQAEETLREAGERHRAISEQAADSIVLVDTESGELVNFNDRAYENLGYTREEFEKLTIPDFEVIESLEEVAKHIEKIIKEGSDVFETQHRTKGGEIRDVQVSSRAICIGSRNFVQSVWRDITEHKRAEEVLRESEENFRHSLDSSPLGIRIITAEGETIYANWAILDIYGYSSIEEFKSIPAVERHTLRSYAERQERVSKRGTGEPVPDRFEQSIIRKNGEVRNLEVFHREVLWGGEKQFQLIYHDITERKQAEEREKQLQKEFSLASRLASVGGLAAGVAHEINNPLTGVLAFSERLLRKSTDEKVSRDLKRINDEARRAARVVERLLTFARRREPEKEYLNINSVVRKALELRAYELKTSNIKVELDLAVGLPKVMVDSHQFQEVFLSIIMNTEQTITEADRGGKLSIKTQPMKDYIRISFTDDGPGIPAEQMDKIFDPFFTTRGKEGGTGLGLSVCYGIVQGHDGRIYAKSKPGKGATFVVELPLTGEKVKEAKKS